MAISKSKALIASILISILVIHLVEADQMVNLILAIFPIPIISKINMQEA